MTLTRWPARLSLLLRRIVWPASLAIACAVSYAGPYSDLQQRLHDAKTSDEVISAVSDQKDIAGQIDISQELKTAASSDADRDTIAKDLRSMVDLGAMAEGAKASNIDQSQAAKIKNSPLYGDQGFNSKRNWLADALNRLKNIHPAETKHIDGGGPNLGWLGQAFTVLIWGALAVGVIVVLFCAIRYIDWRRTLTRKAKTLLEEDEPERTLDEWLLLADEHAAAGRYREAVRALYLSCLLKFDENSIARFERGETNWEHLARINASPLLPVGLDFTTPTQRFDRIWYGHQTRGQADVDQFREWYQEITRLLEATKVKVAA